MRFSLLKTLKLHPHKGCSRRTTSRSWNKQLCPKSHHGRIADSEELGHVLR